MRLRPAGQYSVPAYVLLNPDGVVLGRFINDISIADIKKKIEAELQKALEVPAK
jgi:hypothetical protein